MLQSKKTLRRELALARHSAGDYGRQCVEALNKLQTAERQRDELRDELRAFVASQPLRARLRAAWENYAGVADTALTIGILRAGYRLGGRLVP